MSKGGQSSTTVKLPKSLKNAAEQQLKDARAVGEVGFVPYSGPVAAAFTPQQERAFEGAGMASDAFLGPSRSPVGAAAGLPAPTTFAGGVRGYSAMPMYTEAVGNIAPGQRAAIEGMVINPMTGAAPTGATPPKPAPPPSGGKGGAGRMASGGGSGKGGAMTEDDYINARRGWW